VPVCFEIWSRDFEACWLLILCTHFESKTVRNCAVSLLQHGFLVWSWFDVNPLLTKIWAENYYYIFVPDTLTFRPQILSPSYSCPALPINQKFLRLSCLEKIGGMRRTDRRTERGATFNVAPREGWMKGKERKVHNVTRRYISAICGADTHGPIPIKMCVLQIRHQNMQFL